MAVAFKEKLEKFAEWFASMQITSYKTKSFPDYTPSGNYHFYLLGSPERFNAVELVSIFINDADDILIDRWHEAVADNIQYLKQK